MDIIIPYVNNNSVELRYCLRSIEKYVEHDNIIISGDIPDWVQNVITVKRENRYKAQLDCEMNIVNALDATANDFILFNDDFIALQKVDYILNWYQGDADYVIHLKRQRPSTAPSARWIEETKLWLMSYGIKEPKAFTLHLPVIYNSEKYYNMAERITLPLLKKGLRLLPRMVYGNIHGGINIMRDDVKIYDKDYEITDETFISTHERLLNGKLGMYLAEKFKEKSKYER